MIKPDCYTHMGKIIDKILQSGFKISNLKMHRFTVNQARQFYSEHEGKQYIQDVINFLTTDVVIGMELILEGAVSR